MTASNQSPRVRFGSKPTSPPGGASMASSPGSQPALAESKSGIAGRLGPGRLGDVARLGGVVRLEGMAWLGGVEGPGGAGTDAALAAASRIEAGRFLAGLRRRRGSLAGNGCLRSEVDAQGPAGGIEAGGATAPLGQHPRKADLALVRTDTDEELV